jgi:hypothetical protein
MMNLHLSYLSCFTDSKLLQPKLDLVSQLAMLWFFHYLFQKELPL